MNAGAVTNRTIRDELGRVELPMIRGSLHAEQSDPVPNRIPATNGAAGPMSFGSPLPAHALNTEANSRSNRFPWRGQFSPQLVEALLRAYAAPGSAVLDPYMGCGTVPEPAAGA
ncbi:MAG: hypothetical protein V2B18_11860, partial [Pseudomonadota bacterium]